MTVPSFTVSVRPAQPALPSFLKGLRWRLSLGFGPLDGIGKGPALRVPRLALGFGCVVGPAFRRGEVQLLDVPADVAALDDADERAIGFRLSARRATTSSLADS